MFLRLGPNYMPDVLLRCCKPEHAVLGGSWGIYMLWNDALTLRP